MASLLSLQPSKTVEEKRELTRSKILNSPALPSSSGLLTSFGGLKREESISKSMTLNRNVLGVVVKKSKVDKNEAEKKKTGDKVDSGKNVVDHTKKEVKNSKEIGDNVDTNNSEVDTKNEMKTKEKVKTNILDTSKSDDTKIMNNVETNKIDFYDVNEIKSDAKVESIAVNGSNSLLLIGDYSSSDNSD